MTHLAGSLDDQGWKGLGAPLIADAPEVPSMEVFRDLFISGSMDQLTAIMDEVERSLPPGWTRDRATEDDLKNGTPTKTTYYCFVTGGDETLSATIFIVASALDTLHVSNIISRTKDRLTYGEYNAILEDFHDRVVRPCAERVGAKVELTSDRADLSRWLSDSALKKLRSFTATANKSTGSAHPLDQERWIDFIVTAHRDKSRLDASTLRRWLIEVGCWFPEVADQLASEYEFGGEILTYTEGPRGVA
jgi:hypothetical protein